MNEIITQMIEIIQKLVILMTLQASLLSPAVVDLPLGGIEQLGGSQETLQQKFDKAPQEIKDKYSVENNAFKLSKIVNPVLDVYKSEPKDEIKITIGSETEFKPDIELKRWNEVSFKIKPKGLDLVAEKDKSLSFEADKIKFKTPKMDFEMYDYSEGEGGYKYIWFLNEKPASNKIEFDIESSGLNFYRQPPLTEEYQNGYSEEFQKEIIVTETQVKDLEGNVLVERPENVVGSYAVYHSTKGGMNDAYGKDYKVGKAFHIYRPHLIDANGLEAWGNLHIENGIYSVEIPQDFLDNAVYPIKSNDEFGYGGYGSNSAVDANYLKADSNNVSPGSNGTLASMKMYLKTSSGTYNSKLAIYKDSDNTVLDYTGNISINTTVEWKVGAVIGGASVANGTNYQLAHVHANTAIVYYYDVTGSAGYDYRSMTYSNSFPSPVSWSHMAVNIRFAIYATYTPAVAGARRIITVH